MERNIKERVALLLNERSETSLLDYMSSLFDVFDEKNDRFSLCEDPFEFKMFLFDLKMNKSVKYAPSRTIFAL